MNLISTVCPPNTVSVGEECFRFVDVGKNWKDAAKDCESQGGFLAIPNLTYSNFALELSTVYRDAIGMKGFSININIILTFFS